MNEELKVLLAWHALASLWGTDYAAERTSLIMNQERPKMVRNKAWLQTCVPCLLASCIIKGKRFSSKMFTFPHIHDIFRNNGIILQGQLCTQGPNYGWAFGAEDPKEQNRISQGCTPMRLAGRITKGSAFHPLLSAFSLYVLQCTTGGSGKKGLTLKKISNFQEAFSK